MTSLDTRVLDLYPLPPPAPRACQLWGILHHVKGEDRKPLTLEPLSLSSSFSFPAEILFAPWTKETYSSTQGQAHCPWKPLPLHG